MKKLLLIFCCLFSLVSVAGNDRGVSSVKNPTEPEQVRKKAPHVTEYQPLVVEGRTWWYYNSNAEGKTFEFGVSIGEQEEIDGVLWNRVEVGLREYFGYRDSPGRVFETEPLLVAHVREENQKVYARYSGSYTYFAALGTTCMGSQARYLVGDDDFIEGLVYDFSPAGTETYYGSKEHNWQDYSIDFITTGTYAGMLYNRYLCSTELNEDIYRRIIYPLDFEYFEAIGHVNGLFYSPFSCDYIDAVGAFQQPTLRYVTDRTASNGHRVIYEAAGGKTLWTYYAENMPNPNYKPLVVEGRTWWYYNTNAEGKKCEFGVSIGEQEEIDGVLWNRVEVGLREYFDSVDSPGLVFETEPVLVAHIREANQKVYARYSTSYPGFKALGSTCLGGQMQYLDSDDFIEGLVYDFSSVGTKTYYGSKENNWESYTIVHKTVSIYFAPDTDYIYSNYLCTTEDKVYHLIPLEFRYNEAIGSENGLFYSPFSSDSVDGTDAFQQPTLRYVTATDGTVIYEAEGGKQLWADYAGVENIRVSEPESWFNLQGMPVEKPTSPGIYIRKKGNETVKVAK
ncbi:MAG: hypothetical protein K2L84_06275 [Muribaculaceae bacterium]|nr:hypothetical protein [Muribaculaceae bacterium]